jgi:transmembrane sensor
MMNDISTSNVDEQALEWVRMLPAPTSSQREEFGVWVRRSPKHLHAYLKHKAMSTELNGLDRSHTVDALALVARVRYGRRPPWWQQRPLAGVEMKSARPVPRLLTRQRMAASIIGLALTLSGLWFYMQHSSAHTTLYSTTVGEQREIHLPDGSRIELNTDSLVRVDSSTRLREVYLLSGEALFDVKHNAALPFLVHVNGTLIEDLGTQFSVHRRGDATTVSVIEGLVQVSADDKASSTTPRADLSRVPDVVVTTKEFQPLRKPTRIVAGEEVSIVADGALMQRRALDVAQATAWRHGRVAFNGATLDEIVSEFNRYNVRKIRIHGEALRERRYTGVFDARDPESFIDYLREDTGIEIEDNKDSLILRHN